LCIVYGLAEDEPFSPFLHISVQHGKPRQMENQDRWKTKATQGKKARSFLFSYFFSEVYGG